MPIVPFTALACPLDGEPLAVIDNGLRCGRGHTFDRARQGYVNLLAVQHKASRDPGDSKDMVAARRRVLDSGVYAPIADAVATSVRALLDDHPAGRPFRLLDAGCGEGYYLVAIARACAAAVSDVELIGIDVSKWAVIAAAKRSDAITWAVANNRHPPVAAGSLDLILSMFGFSVWEGFAPTQAVDAHVLLVDPGPDHLIELREIIYPVVTRSGPPDIPTAALALGYALQSEYAVRFTADLASQSAIADLIAMTPHAHRISEAARRELAARSSLTITGEAVLRLLRRTG